MVGASIKLQVLEARGPSPSSESLYRNTQKKKGGQGIVCRIVKSERLRDGLVGVLADHSTDDQEIVVEKMGNRCPRDPLEGR